MVNNLNKIMKEKKLKINDIVQISGLDKSLIYRCSKNETIPRLDNAMRIANALGVSIYDIWKL